MLNVPTDKKIILFDGVCNLCNTSVQKIIRFDKQGVFVFASLQSKIGKKILEDLNIDRVKTDSIILHTSDEFYIKSSAVLKIMDAFGGFWKLTQVLWIFPKFIRDVVYDIIAKNRYKWFGKQDNCMIPSAELKVRFL